MVDGSGTAGNDEYVNQSINQLARGADRDPDVIAELLHPGPPGIAVNDPVGPRATLDIMWLIGQQPMPAQTAAKTSYLRDSRSTSATRSASSSTRVAS